MKNEINLKKIKQVALLLSQKSEEERNNFLTSISKVLDEHTRDIIAANQKDIRKAKENKLSGPFIERLILDKGAIKQVILRLNAIQKLTSYIGKELSKRTLPNGIILKKVAVPIGVILVIFEARPEVMIDVAAICIKSGNVAILKGGSEALYTNEVLYICIQEALKRENLPKEAITLVKDRNVMDKLLKEDKYIDLVIARGGYDLVKKVMIQSKIPVLAHSEGGARIYIDKSADLKIAERVIINAKISKPSACNSLDTILVHKDIASKFVPKIIDKLKSLNVEIAKNNWEREWLALKMNIKIVNDVYAAIKFINKYSKKHSEGIIATDKEVIDVFIKGLDTAAVFINCSTRFNDGYEFGMGSEMGISTGKLHARGPVGLQELATYRWEAHGNGQVRE